MKTTVVLQFTHAKAIPELAEIAAGRGYTIDGVEDCEVLKSGIYAGHQYNKLPEYSELRIMVKEAA